MRRVAGLVGRADLSIVWPTFNAWDRKAREHLRQDCPPEFTGMRSRAGTLVLKSAMLFHASVDPTNLVVTLRDLDQAIDFVERSQRRAERYLSEEVAHDRHELYRLRVLDMLRRAGGRITWSLALTKSHLTAREFNEAIATLEESEQLVIEYGRSKQRRLALPEHIYNRTNGVEH